MSVKVALKDEFGTSIGWSAYKHPKTVYHRAHPHVPGCALCKPSLKLEPKSICSVVPFNEQTKYCGGCAMKDSHFSVR